MINEVVFERVVSTFALSPKQAQTLKEVLQKHYRGASASGQLSDPQVIEALQMYLKSI